MSHSIVFVTAALAVTIFFASVAKALDDVVESSVATGDSVCVVESVSDPTVRCYGASTASVVWERTVTAGLPGREQVAIDLQTDEAGNVVSAAYLEEVSTGRGLGSPGFTLLEPRVFQFTVLNPATGEPSDASPPALENPDINDIFGGRGIPGFQIVNGQVAGIFLSFFRRGGAGHIFLPGGGVQLLWDNPMLAIGYLGSGFNFVLVPDSNNPGQELISVTTDSPFTEFPSLGVVDSRIVFRPEPSTGSCAPTIDGSGDYLVFASHTPIDGECSLNPKTLVIQVLDRETLQAKWTTYSDGDYVAEDPIGVYPNSGYIAVTSRNGKVYVAVPLSNGSVRLTELDGETGSVGYTQDTTRAPNAPAHLVEAVHVLSSGTVAITGVFDGVSPVAFYSDGQFRLAITDSCD